MIEKVEKVLEELQKIALEKIKILGKPIPKGELFLTLNIALSGSREHLHNEAINLTKIIDAEINDLIAHMEMLPVGRIHCLKCNTATCEHSAPTKRREVFVGYKPNGTPEFRDLTQALLDKGHPQTHRLFEKKPPILALAIKPQNLFSNLLPGFKPWESMRIHGAVICGWFIDKEGEKNGITFLLVSSGTKRSRRKFYLHTINLLAAKAELDKLLLTNGTFRWDQPLQWSKKMLKIIEADLRSNTLTKAFIKKIEARLNGVLDNLALRLEKITEKETHYTKHAVERKSANRPVSQAFLDLKSATVDWSFYDDTEKSIVIVGPKSRVHIFSPNGKLITSIRYSSEAIQRKIRSGKWQRISLQQLNELKKNAIRN